MPAEETENKMREKPVVPLCQVPLTLGACLSIALFHAALGLAAYSGIQRLQNKPQERGFLWAGFIALLAAMLLCMQAGNAQALIALSLKKPWFRIFAGALGFVLCVAAGAAAISLAWMAFEGKERLWSVQRIVFLVCIAFAMMGVATLWLGFAIGTDTAIEKLKSIANIC